MYYRRSCFIQEDKEDRDQDVGSCGSLTCRRYIVLVQSTPAENRTRILCCPLVLGRTRLGGGISLNTICRFMRYIPQALPRAPTRNRKKDGRERPTRPDRATRPERARGGPCRRVFGGGANITTSLSLRSRLGGRNEKENENGNASRRVAVCGRKGFLILIKHRKPHTRRRRRRLSPARSCRWGWSSSSPGRPCARRGP